MVKEYQRAWQRAYYQRNKEKIRAADRKRWWERRDYHIKRSKEYCDALKLDVITYYGGGKTACVKCGFDDIRALSIDHIGGLGTEHRDKLKRSGYRFYLWLKKENYPTGYQTLCMNCQFIKKHTRNENPNLNRKEEIHEGVQLSP